MHHPKELLAFPRPAGASEQWEHALLHRVMLHDDAALEALYERFSGTVYSVARAILQNRVDAEEVVQETFTHLWTRARDYSPQRGSPGTWVVMLARSRAIDLLRSRRHKARAALRREEDAALAEPPPSPFELTRWARAWFRVSTGLSTLPPEQRHALDLAFQQGLTHREIAARTGEPLGTVKTRIRRGLERLGRLFATAEDE
jgi:RNA polymerase sigma-70 factor, ECF subfamily